ncbi:MIF4G like-domain-containing protein [Lipomyces arxii]|uniref:MIF4G like-domain-containing protein n=1 Tax=Lipomyces arxii TaxID=56418 RepID=UPI0034CD11CB
MSATDSVSPSNGGQDLKRSRDDDGEPVYKRQRYNGPRSDYQRQDKFSQFARFRKLFTCLGEPARFSLGESIRHSANVLAEQELGEDMFKNFMEVIYNIVIEQPLKTFSVAVALQVANGRQSTIGAELLKYISVKLQVLLDSGDWNKVKLVLRFLVMMIPMLENADAVTDIIEKLLAKSVELKKETKVQSRLSEEIYGVVLFLVPYLAFSVPADDMKAKATALFAKSKEFDYKPPKSTELISPFVDFHAPYKVYDVLDLMQTQMTELVESENPWEVELLHDCSTLMPKEFEKHALPDITVPDILTTTKPDRTPDLYLRFYLPQQFETTPSVSKIESSLIRDLLTDTILNLDFNRQEVARQLASFDSFLRDGIMAPREMPLEKLAQLEGRSTWKPEDLAMEAILSSLFRLPKPKCKPVFFHSVLIEACILYPHAIAPVFGRGVRFLYSQLEHLDVQVIYVFVDWLAHHLSNFGYTWKWKEWSEDLNLNDMHPKKVFIRELILKELRFSFPQRIKETLPDEFMQFVYDGEDIPLFKMIAPGEPFAEQAREITQNIRDRKEIQDFDEVFEKVRSKCAELGNSDADSVIREIVITAILHSGARSLSHVDTWVDRCLTHLKKLYPEDDLKSQRDAVKYVFNFWEDQTGTAVQVVKKLMNYGIITPLSVAEWIVIDSDVGNLSRGYSWELLGFALDKAKFFIAEAERTLRFRSDDEDLESVEPVPDEESKAIDEKVASAKAKLDLIFVTIVKELSRPVNGDSTNEQTIETVRWKRWWKDGFLRATMRKYHLDYKKLQEPLKNLGLTDTFILNCIDQTAELTDN